MSDRSRFYTAVAHGIVGAIVGLLCRAHTLRHSGRWCLLGQHQRCPGWSAGRPVSRMRHCQCDHHYRLDGAKQA